MGAMTNHTVPDHRTGLGPDLLALDPIGGKRRPAKVVEHPVFRAARARIALDAPFTVLRVPVVLLSRPAAAPAYGCGDATSGLVAA